MAKKLPAFQYGECVSCSICVQACPISCIELTENHPDTFKNLYPEADHARCTGCGLCAKQCPMEAIAMEDAG